MQGAGLRVWVLGQGFGLKVHGTAFNGFTGFRRFPLWSADFRGLPPVLDGGQETGPGRPAPKRVPNCQIWNTSYDGFGAQFDIRFGTQKLTSSMVRCWYRVQGTGFRVQGTGFRVQGSAYNVQNFHRFPRVFAGFRGSARKRNPGRPEPKGVSFNLAHFLKWFWYTV